MARGIIVTRSRINTTKTLGKTPRDCNQNPFRADFRTWHNEQQIDPLFFSQLYFRGTLLCRFIQMCMKSLHSLFFARTLGQILTSRSYIKYVQIVVRYIIKPAGSAIKARKKEREEVKFTTQSCWSLSTSARKERLFRILDSLARCFVRICTNFPRYSITLSQGWN